MQRDIKKAINEYHRIAAGNKGAFFASDINQIHDMSDNPWDWICDALTAGFAIGYRTAIREAKKKAPVDYGRSDKG